ncbi:SDR family NAD(P)-dependent oxidoreductase [Flavobacteriaceae bacterium 3-367]
MKTSKKLRKRLKANYGPWALVTGASSGIGQELATRLAEAGLSLILTGRRGPYLETLGETLESKYRIRTKTIIADLSYSEEVYSLVEAIGDVEVGLFVASAGFGTSGSFVDAELDTELRMLRVNSFALLMLTHYYARKFSERKRGGIILMSSLVGFQGVPHAAHYAATKAYVQSLGEALYHELRPYGVDVLSAAPGPVNSGFSRIAQMQMGNALRPDEIGVPILKALGRTATVFPGGLSKILMLGLRTMPRWGKIRIMQMVMAGMTKHQKCSTQQRRY